MKEWSVRKIFTHLVAWIAVYGLWIAIFRSYSVALSKTMTIEFCYLIFITADYYIITEWSIPQLLLKRKYTALGVITIFTIAVSAFFRAWVALYMNLHYFKTPTPPEFSTLYLNSFLNISLWVLLLTVAKMMMDSKQTQAQVNILERDRVNNELNYLKAQINPHALFNSLNTIYGHIDKSNQTARNILLQFSDILRYQLYDCNAEKVALEKELLFVKNYVNFQRLRKDDSLSVNLTIGKIDPGLQLAPLLLIVLIENAFKFAGREITIAIHTEGKVLRGYFYNTTETIQPFPGNTSGGIGLVNLHRRMELLYPGKYQLESRTGEHFYETFLTIDLS